MKVLVTGADGFVGCWVLRRLREEGHEAWGGVRSGEPDSRARLTPEERGAIPWVSLELTDDGSVRRALNLGWDAIVHLAAIASTKDSDHDPGHAWHVNAGGTARLLHAAATGLAEGQPNPLCLVVSSSDVYGPGTGGLRVESDRLDPLSIYAATKVGAEVAAGQVARQWGLRVIIARPFPHIGPGQTDRLVPNWIAAVRAGEPKVAVDWDAVRDFLDVRDVADAYLALLARGRPGECYNVASGVGIRFPDLLNRLVRIMGEKTESVPLGRPRRATDATHSVGDPGKLRAQTGWSPQFSLDATLEAIVRDA